MLNYYSTSVKDDLLSNLYHWLICSAAQAICCWSLLVERAGFWVWRVKVLAWEFNFASALTHKMILVLVAQQWWSYNKILDFMLLRHAVFKVLAELKYQGYIYLCSLVSPLLILMYGAKCSEIEIYYFFLIQSSFAVKHLKHSHFTDGVMLFIVFPHWFCHSGL